MDQVSGKNPNPFWSAQEEWLKYTCPSTPLSKEEGLKDIGHNMSIGNLILVVNSVMVSYLICYNSLLQNATDVTTKCDSCFITKCDRSLLQNASVFFITKCDSYYKIRRLLQIETVQPLIVVLKEVLKIQT